jgi:hypothetical protein
MHMRTINIDGLMMVDINYAVVDRLVLEYLNTEELIEVCTPRDAKTGWAVQQCCPAQHRHSHATQETTSLPSCLHGTQEADELQVQAASGRAAAHAAHALLLNGNIPAVMSVVAATCPSVLNDQRLVFRLKRQQFVELLRRADAQGDAAALQCARDELAPLALDAYPEAYLDFKRAMLLLLQRQQQDSSSIAQDVSAKDDAPASMSVTHPTVLLSEAADWSILARQQLAETLLHTMLQQLGAFK